MPDDLYDRIQSAAAAVRKVRNAVPAAAIVLGTGLGALAREITDAVSIPYGDLTGFPVSTAPGHRGELVLGRLAGRPVVAMEGRFHLYEGYTPQEITFPVRVLRALGARVLVLSGTCGAMNPAYRAGDIVLIGDHLNFMGVNPLVGPNDERLGPRFPDMSRPYDPELLAAAEAAAKRRGVPARRGVYAALLGPCLETRAEYRWLRNAGADVVGMSTVPEVIVGIHAGFRILALSVVTDLCDPDHLEPADIAKIIAVANAAEPRLTAVVMDVIGSL